jgi:DHA1 family inner membrane transport protein
VSSPVAPAARLPFVVVLLTLGTFLMCTSEYLVAGLLPQLASGLRVGVAQAGLLITAFAAGMIAGGPVMAVATARLPRRAVLVLALAVFAAGHVLAALSSDFALVLAARVLTALVTGAFWSVASAVATAASGPAAASRALGVMMSGVGLATVAGVPLGSWAGQHLGWRAAFWALAVLAAAAAVVIGRFVPADGPREVISPGAQLAALRSRRLWLMLAGTVFVTGGYMATFSYIAPLLTEGSGLPASAVPLVLAGYGAGALAGTNAGGRLADRWPVATFISAAAGTGLIQLLLFLLSGSAPATVVLLVLLGATGMAVPPVATGLAVRFAGAAPALAAGLAVSAFNAGIALGSWIAGYALDSSLGVAGPALVGAVMAAVGLVPLIALAVARVRPAAPAAVGSRPHAAAWDEVLPERQLNDYRN